MEYLNLISLLQYILLFLSIKEYTKDLIKQIIIGEVSVFLFYFYLNEIDFAFYMLIYYPQHYLFNKSVRIGKQSFNIFCKIHYNLKI